MKLLDAPVKREALKNPHTYGEGFDTTAGQDVGTSHSTGMPRSKNTQNPLGNASKRTKGM